MRCAICKVFFNDNELELSHDIPKYCGGEDKDGRHYLCKDCHDTYEKMILSRCYVFVYKKLLPHYKDRRNYISCINKIKKELDLMKKAKFWNIAKEVKEEVFKNVNLL
jgi:hypothetical protein